MSRASQAFCWIFFFFGVLPTILLLCIYALDRPEESMTDALWIGLIFLVMGLAIASSEYLQLMQNCEDE
jgi:uncharacterized membrane protein